MVLEYTLHLSPEEVATFTKTIIEKLQRSACDDEQLFSIRLALDEAIINAIKHGNKMDKDKDVYLRVEADGEKIQAEVKDEGAGFDYCKLSLPTEDDHLHKLSGRGVFLINNIMDRVDFSDSGSRIKMIKYLKSEGMK